MEQSSLNPKRIANTPRIYPARPSAGTKITSRQDAKNAKKTKPDLCLALRDLCVFARDMSLSSGASCIMPPRLSRNRFQLLGVSNVASLAESKEPIAAAMGDDFGARLHFRTRWG